MEEEEEARTAVDAETEITTEEIEAKDITTLVWAVQLRKDYAMLLAPVCLNTAISRPKTKRELHGRNFCNTSARITANI